MRTVPLLLQIKSAIVVIVLTLLNAWPASVVVAAHRPDL